MITDSQAVQLMRMYVASLDRPALMAEANRMLLQYIRQYPENVRVQVVDWLWEWYVFGVNNFTQNKTREG